MRTSERPAAHRAVAHRAPAPGGKRHNAPGNKVKALAASPIRQNGAPATWTGRKARLPNENASRAARGILMSAHPELPERKAGQLLQSMEKVSNFIQTPSVNERIL